MSFSSDVKSELAKTENLLPCCFHAQVYGLVLFAHFSKYNFSITTENNDVFSLYLSYLRDYCAVEPVISNNGTKKMTAYLKTDKDKEKAFEKFGLGGTLAGLFNCMSAFGLVLANYVFAKLADEYGWGFTTKSWLIIGIISLILTAITIPIWNNFKKKMDIK